MRVSQQESAVLVNLDHIAGSLATVPVAEVLTPADTAQDTGAIHNVLSIEPYVDAQGLTSYIARRGRCVWIGRPQASYDRLEPGSGVYAQYEMTEDTDPVYDHAGGIAGITLTNVGTSVEQLWSTNVRHFDGYSAFLEDTESGYGSRFNFAAGARSVSAWIRQDAISTQGWSIIAGKSDDFLTPHQGWALCLNPSQQLVMFVSDGTNWVQSVSVRALNLNQWYHIGASYNPATSFFPQLFLDGMPLTVTTGTGNLVSGFPTSRLVVPYPSISAGTSVTVAYTTTGPGTLSVTIIPGVGFTIFAPETAGGINVTWSVGTMVANTAGGDGGTTAVNSDNSRAFAIGSTGADLFFNGSIGCLSVYSADESGGFPGQWENENQRYFPHVSPYIPVPYRWTPLLVDTTDGSAMSVSSRLALCKERVKQIGYRAYFSPESPAASDYLMAWDGVIVDKILVTNAGSAVGGDNLYAVSNNPNYGLEGMSQFEFAGVQPGDVLIYNPGVWPLQGHVITAVCTTRGAGYGVYTSAPIDLTACEAVIVRVRRAGVLMGETTATTDTTTVSTVSTLAANVYQYCHVYSNSLSEYSGNASLESSKTVPYFMGIISGNAHAVAGVLTVACPGIAAGATVNVNWGTPAGSGTLSVVVTPGVGFVIKSTALTDTAVIFWNTQILPAIAVSGWSLTPPWNIDTLQIYRSDMGAAGAMNPFYLLKTIALNVPGTIAGASVTERVVPTSYIDDGTDIPNLKKPLLEAVGHEQPGPLGNLYDYNSRLYTSNIGEKCNVLEMSTLAQYEYWPGVEYDQVAATATNANIGGSVQLGASAAEPITAMVSETGTFITTGLVGSDLLVFFPTRALRWNGNTAADFQVSEGVSVGAMNPALAVNAGEYIIWFDGDHFRSLPIGGSAPEIISFQLWPRGFKDYLSKTGYVDVTSIVSDWSACYKNGWYYVACTFTAGNINDTILAYHLASKTWKTYSVGVEDICAGAITGAANNPNLVGVSSTSDVNGLYNLVNIESGIPSSGYPISFNRISGPINPAKEAEHMRDLKTIHKITALMDTPRGDQTVKFSLYANGNLVTPVATDSQILLANPAIYNGSPYPGKQIIEWTPPAYSAVVLQVGISGTFTEPANIEWLQVTVETT
jgi:hypothetical protein